MNTLDLIIVAVSLLIVVVVGIIASRKKSGTAGDYFLASGRLPWWIIGSAFVSTSVSSEQIVGTVGAAYEHGMVIANWEWWTLPTYALLIVLFIPIYLQNRVTTVPDFLNRRYGALCRDIYSWVMLVAYVVVFLVPVLYSGSLAVASLMGWNHITVLWSMVVLVAAYTVKGGLNSVMWTDAVQCLMLVGGGLLLYFYALSAIPGGWSAMVAARPDRFHLYRPPSDPTAPFPALVLASAGVFLFYQAGNQVMVQRVLGARTTWDGMMGIVFAGFINLVRPLITCFLGFVVFHWTNVLHHAPPLDNKDTAFTFAMQTFAPEWGLRGIVLAGFFAAVMSTLSALSNSTATILSLEVFQRLSPSSGERTTVRVGQIASLVSLILAGCMAPLVQRAGGIFGYFQTGVTYLATPFISVLLLGILWKRANLPGALFGIVGGLFIQVALAISLPLIWPTMHFLYIAAIAEVAIVTGVVVTSMCTAAPQLERWKPFVWTPAVLRQFKSQQPRSWFANPWLWAGLYAAIWLGIYARFW